MSFRRALMSRQFAFVMRASRALYNRCLHGMGGNSVFWRSATTMASSAGVSTVLFGAFGPIRASAVVVRRRHFRTVLGFRP